MSQLLELRTAVINAIKPALPGFDVAGHLGRFAPADLNQFLLKAPAVRVAVLGLTNTRIILGDDEAEYLAGVAKLAIVVITKDQGARLSREEAAIAASERICKLAIGARWGLPFTRAADAPSGQTVYNDATLSKGVAIWGIELAQPVVLSPADDGGAPAGPLSALWLGIAPEIGAAHRDDYHGPITAETVTIDIEGGANV